MSLSTRLDDRRPDSAPRPGARVAPGACRHCGSRVPDGAPSPDFCCAGCEAVHALLSGGGLLRYYDLAGGRTAPAEPPRDRSHAWLDPLVTAAEEAARGGDLMTIMLDVQGIHCAACVWLMNELFRRRAGGVGVTVNPALGKVRLTWRRGFDVAAYLAEVERFGYLFGPDRKRPDAASRDLPVRIGICAAITGNVMLFSTSFYLGLGGGAIYTLFSRLTVALSALVVIVGGGVFFRAALRGLRRGVLHLDLPIAAGIALAFGASFVQARSGHGDRAYFDTLNVFVTLMLVGRWLQQRVLERNRRFLLEDDGADGLQVRRRVGERLETVRAATIRAGDRLVVAPGDLVPVESELVGEPACFSRDWITGEPDVHGCVTGGTVAAGSFNAGRCAAEMRARTSFQESPLPALLCTTGPGGSGERERDRGDERGATGRGKRRRPATRRSLREKGRQRPRVPAHLRFFHIYARGYVVGVLGLAALALVLWWRVDPARAIDVTVAVLVVSCPCAVGLAAPLAHELVQARLRRAGLFVRSADLLDRLPRVRTLLFDKTGTLALGRLELRDASPIAALDPVTRDAAFDMVSRSNHPVARCIAAALHRTGARFRDGAPVLEEPGAGLSLVRDGHAYRLGRARFALPGATADSADTVLSVDGVERARLTPVETPRPDARRELAALQQSGLQAWLLSGDGRERVERFAAAVGIDPARALGGLRPEEKAARVAALDADDTLYLGDGVNDSLAFERAFVAGTPAIDRPVLPGKSDFFLVGEGLAPLREAIALSGRLRNVLRRNLAIALVYNAFAVAACLLGVMSPLRAALAMPASSLLVLLITTTSLAPRAEAEPLPALRLEEVPVWKS